MKKKHAFFSRQQTFLCNALNKTLSSVDSRHFRAMHQILRYLQWITFSVQCIKYHAIFRRQPHAIFRRQQTFLCTALNSTVSSLDSRHFCAIHLIPRYLQQIADISVQCIPFYLQQTADISVQLIKWHTRPIFSRQQPFLCNALNTPAIFIRQQIFLCNALDTMLSSVDSRHFRAIY